MTDPEILSGCKENNRAAQKALYMRYAGKMLVVCLRYAGHRAEAEDLLQEGFIKVFKHIHEFRNEGSLEGWVRKIMINTALKQFHQKKMEWFPDTVEEFELKSDWSDAINRISEKELIKHIAGLPTGYKLIFNLYALEGYSHAEIANQLNIAESTSRSQLVKARKLLQNKIISDGIIKKPLHNIIK